MLPAEPLHNRFFGNTLLLRQGRSQGYDGVSDVGKRALIAEFFGTASHGAIFGMMIFVSNIGGAIGPLLAGYVFDLTGSYRGMLWGLPLISTAGLGAALMLRSPARR